MKRAQINQGETFRPKDFFSCGQLSGLFEDHIERISAAFCPFLMEERELYSSFPLSKVLVPPKDSSTIFFTSFFCPPVIVMFPLATTPLAR